MKSMLIFLILQMLNMGGEWEELETEHFHIRYHMEKEREVKRLYNSAEEIRQEILDITGLKYEEKVEVIFASDKDEFFKIQPGGRNIPGWVSGIAYSHLRLIILKPLDGRDIRHNSLKGILSHEYSHIVFGSAMRGRNPPRWLNEGLAMTHAGEGSLLRQGHLTWAMATGRLIPLEKITYFFPVDSNYAQIAYAESFDFISYLRTKYGELRFRNVLSEYIRGKDLNQALLDILGKDLKSLERDWREKLKKRGSTLIIITSSIFIWFLISILFLVSYLIKKKRMKLKKIEWEEEEKEIFYH